MKCSLNRVAQRLGPCWLRCRWYRPRKWSVCCSLADNFNDGSNDDRSLDAGSINAGAIGTANGNVTHYNATSRKDLAKDTKRLTELVSKARGLLGATTSVAANMAAYRKFS